MTSTTTSTTAEPVESRYRKQDETERRLSTPLEISENWFSSGDLDLAPATDQTEAEKSGPEHAEGRGFRNARPGLRKALRDDADCRGPEADRGGSAIAQLSQNKGVQDDVLGHKD